MIEAGKSTSKKSDIIQISGPIWSRKTYVLDMSDDILMAMPIGCRIIMIWNI